MDRFDLMSMWSPLLSQTCPCSDLYYVKSIHVVTSIKSKLSMWSPLLSQTCTHGNFLSKSYPCGHLYIQVITWTGLT
jgi:hypothetical protein